MAAIVDKAGDTSNRFKYYDPASGSYSYGGELPKSDPVDNSNRFKYYDPRTGTYSYGGQLPSSSARPSYDRPEIKDTVEKLTGGRSVQEILSEMNAAYAAEAAKVQSAISAQLNAQRKMMEAERKRQLAEAKRARNSVYDAVTRDWERRGLDGKEIRKALKGLAENDYLDAHTLTERVRKTQTWANRFGAVSKAREKAGLSYLDEGQIVALEDGYKEVLSKSGMPAGYYDSFKDFQNWISNDVSVAEIGERVNLAEAAVNNSDPNYVLALKNLYGLRQGDLVAYFLDRTRGVEVLNQQLQAADIGAAALDTGIGIDRTFTENLVDRGVNRQMAQQVFSEVAETGDQWRRLAAMGRESLTDQSLVEMDLGMDPETGKKVKRLASQERSRWAGTGGGTSAFGSNRSGSY